MSISARLARLEEVAAVGMRYRELVAEDDDDLESKYLRAWLSAGPGPLALRITVAGQRRADQVKWVPTYEEALEAIGAIDSRRTAAP